jgi:hypothetical protein
MRLSRAGSTGDLVAGDLPVTTIPTISHESSQQLARHRGHHRRFRLILSDRETRNLTMPKPETEIERQIAQKIVNTRLRLDRIAAIGNNLAQPDLNRDLRLYQTRLARMLRAYTAEYGRLREHASARRQTTLWSNIPQA